MKTVKSPKGNDLPLINLKGKDYLMVAHRIQWFNEAVENFNIETDFITITDEQTIAKARVQVVKDGRILKSATATKRETKQDFADHTEKAETAAIGRALAMLGYGTQFAVADLDEGDRIVDAPLKSKEDVKTKTTPGDTGSDTSYVLPTSINNKAVSTSKSIPDITAISTTNTQRPIKELINSAFKVLEAQKKITKEEFKTKYQKGQGLSSLDETSMVALLNAVKKDFPHLNIN